MKSSETLEKHHATDTHKYTDRTDTAHMNAGNDDTAYRRGDNDTETTGGRMTRITTRRKIKTGTVMRFDTWIDGGEIQTISTLRMMTRI